MGGKWSPPGPKDLNIYSWLLSSNILSVTYIPGTRYVFVSPVINSYQSLPPNSVSFHLINEPLHSIFFQLPTFASELPPSLWPYRRGGGEFVNSLAYIHCTHTSSRTPSRASLWWAHALVAHLRPLHDIKDTARTRCRRLFLFVFFF